MSYSNGFFRSLTVALALGYKTLNIAHIRTNLRNSNYFYLLSTSAAQADDETRKSVSDPQESETFVFESQQTSAASLPHLLTSKHKPFKQQ